MRITLGFGRRVWVFETQVTRVVLKNSGDAEDDACEDENFEHVPQDPHSTVMAHAELSPHALGVTGTSGFGFRGREG